MASLRLFQPEISFKFNLTGLSQSRTGSQLSPFVLSQRILILMFYFSMGEFENFSFNWMIMTTAGTFSPL